MKTRLQRLKARSDLLWSIRSYFRERDYTELDVPCLIRTPSIEPHIDPFLVQSQSGEHRYLHTSPEYAIKKLLSIGLENVFYLGPCFRDEPKSRLHHPEFTMLEWYSTGASLFELMDETEQLLTSLWSALGSAQIQRHGIDIDLAVPFMRKTVSEVFEDAVGFCPIKHSTLQALSSQAMQAGLRFSENCTSYDDLFHQLFLNYVEPNLSSSTPTFVWGWPESQAALAKLTTTEPRVALRFELYAGGLELANAFDELTNAEEQRHRFLTERAERKALGKPVFELDESLLSSLAQIPQTSGIALGVDRVLMLLLNAEYLEEIRP